MMMTFAACLWVGLFPLLQCGTYSHITEDKWTFMLILSGVTMGCFIYDKIVHLSKPHVTRIPLHRPKLSRSIICILIISSLLTTRMILSCYLSSYSWTLCWKGYEVRNQGLFAHLIYMSLFVLFVFSSIKPRPIIVSAAIGVLFYGTIVFLQRSGINALQLYPGKLSYNTNPEFQGTIGNVDMNIGYLSIIAGLLLTEITSLFSNYSSPSFIQKPSYLSPKKNTKHSEHIKKSTHSILYLDLLFFSLCVTIYLIVTMNVNFGFIMLGVLLIITLFVWTPRKLRILLFVLIWIVAFCIIWFWDKSYGGVWEIHEILHGRTQLSFGSNRIAVWTYSIALAFQSPIFGGGSGTFRSRFNTFIWNHGLEIPNSQGIPGEPGYIQFAKYWDDYVYDNPHNEYIAHLVDHGLLAMLLFIALIISVVVASVRKASKTAIYTTKPRHTLSPFAAAVICYSVQAFFSFSNSFVTPMFWVIMGICVSQNWLAAIPAGPGGETKKTGSLTAGK